MSDTAAIAYLEKHWQEMGLEYVDGGVPARLSQEHDVSGSWDVEYARVGKWRTLPDTRSDFEALAIAEKILRDRLKRQCDKVSVSDHGHFVIVRIRRGDDRQSVSRDTAVEALHLACIALEAG